MNKRGICYRKYYKDNHLVSRKQIIFWLLAPGYDFLYRYMMAFFIIVIGASAGGQDALCKLASSLPNDINAAVFIVLHLSPQSINNFLISRLQKCSALPCLLAIDELPVKPGHIYIAPADHHLVLRPGATHLTKSPAENRWRPSIDVLFRSAAVHYSERVIGIVLSGLLYDGTAGMQAIKICGGACIVQDPKEAAYPDMPQSVLDNTIVDFMLPVSEMGGAIQQIINTKTITGVQVPETLKAEAALVDDTVTEIGTGNKLGEQSLYSCPDCGGSLWEIKEGEHVRYRCHIGHGYAEGELLKHQAETLNATLWIALRMMEERRNLLNKMSHKDESKSLYIFAKMHAERAREMDTHINNLKEFLFRAKTEDQ